MLLALSIEESEKWDTIVKSFDNYDIYYLSSYSKAFKLHGDGEPILFYFEDGDFRAINVVMKRDIKSDAAFLNKLDEDLYFDLATPYGYGGFLLSGEITEERLNKLDFEYCVYCKNNKIISEFVRFHPVIKNQSNMGKIYDVLELGQTVSIELDTKERIWDNLSRENRNKIRKAQKSGVEIFCGRNADLYEKFINLYNQTMDKNNASKYYYFNYDFYKSLLYDSRYNSLIFYAEYESKIIAMAIILFSNNNLHYHLSGANKEYQEFAPVNLLLYEASIWGCENGYKTFHLGGGVGGKTDNLYKFKSGFNRNSSNAFAIGRKIFDEERYNKLVAIKEESGELKSENTFFPRYRG